MTKFTNNRKAPSAFKKLGVVALFAATTLTLATFFTACNQTSGGEGGKPTIEGVAVLTLDPNRLYIDVKAITSDGSAIKVEGCNETTLKSDTEARLTATGTKVVLKGKITDLLCCNNKLTELNVQGLTSLQGLDCGGNQLTKLDVQGLTALQSLFCYDNQLTELGMQGCTALKRLDCYRNKLNAQAMTKILNALPARSAGDDGEAILYTEFAGFNEGNCKDLTNPPELNAAFEGAKGKNWMVRKQDTGGSWVDI